MTEEIAVNNITESHTFNSIIGTILFPYIRQTSLINKAIYSSSISRQEKEAKI